MPWPMLWLCVVPDELACCGCFVPGATVPNPGFRLTAAPVARLAAGESQAVRRLIWELVYRV